MTAFSQRDPRWTRNTLGDSSLTIGEAGCLITAVATILTDWDVPIPRPRATAQPTTPRDLGADPARLNRWLRDNAGYHEGCLFRFASVAGLGADLLDLIRCPNTPAPLHTLNLHLQAGRAIVAELDATPGQPPRRPHWIRLQEPARAGHRILDPWREPGDELADMPPAYALPGWDAARIITAAAIYQHNPARVLPFALQIAGHHQDTPAICPTPGT